MANDLIALRCDRCGGKLVFDPAKADVNLVKTADGGYVVIASSDRTRTLKCQNCDTEYIPGSQLKTWDDGRIVVGNITNSSVAIGNGASVTIHGGVPIPQSQRKVLCPHCVLSFPIGRTIWEFAKSKGRDYEVVEEGYSCPHCKSKFRIGDILANKD